MENKELKLFLFGKHLDHSMDEIEKQYIEQAKDNFINELYNVSKTKVKLLTEEETLIIRKLIGVFDNGIAPTLTSTAEYVNLTLERLRNQKRKILQKLYFNLYTLEQPFSETEIEKINENKVSLSDPIEKLNLSISKFLKFHRQGIHTIEDLTALSESELQEMVKIGSERKAIIDKLHFLGFSLKNDVTPIETEEEKEKRILSLSISVLNISKETYFKLSKLGIETLGNLIAKSLKGTLKDEMLEEIQNSLNDFGLTLAHNRKIDDEATLLKKYKNLLTQKQKLQTQLNKVDDEIASVLQQMNKEPNQELEEQKEHTIK